MFSLFFKDEITFRTILQNISDNLKIGGFVIGTTFDGERIYNALKSDNVITGKTFSGETMWRIEKNILHLNSDLLIKDLILEKR